MQVSEMQRARILTAMAQVIAEHGAGSATVARVVTRARISRRTFYDQFSSCEECLLSMFEVTVERAVAIACGAAVASSSWREQVRAGLGALLEFFEEEPASGSLLVVDALGAGPHVLERRAFVLGEVATVLDRGRSEAKGDRAPSSLPLTAEGMVGAVLSVIHARMSGRGAQRRGKGTAVASSSPRSALAPNDSLVELLNPLMAMIVLPYLGPAAAQRELERPALKVQGASKARGQASGLAGAVSVSDPLADLPMRLTYRTMRVLGAIAEGPGSSNREIGDAAGASDQGQISKLLTRLEKLGLVENSSGQGHQPTGEPNAWCLTALGERVSDAMWVSSSGGSSGGQVINRGVSPSDSEEKR